MQYLDPRSPNPSKTRAAPAVGALNGKTVGFLNNGWRSLGRIGKRIEGPLKTRHGVSQVIYYDLPRSTAPPAGFLERVASECQAVIVGMAN